DMLQAYAARGAFHQDQGEHDLAIADFDKVLSRDDKAFGIFALRGNSLRDKGEYDRAIADYDASLRILPNQSSVLHDRGVAYRLKGDRERAIADFREVVRLTPMASAASLKELHELGVEAPKTEREAFKQGVLDLLK